MWEACYSTFFVNWIGPAKKKYWLTSKVHLISKLCLHAETRSALENALLDSNGLNFDNFNEFR